MKKIRFALIAACMIGTSANAQLLEGLGRKMKDKVQQRINTKIDNTANSGLDKIEERVAVKGKQQPSDKGHQNGAKEQWSDSPSKALTAYGKFDFIAGEKIIYLDDFSKDPLGELPIKWNASGKGEVVRVDQHTGKFLRLFPGTKYLSANTTAFGDSFTIEFDLIMDGTPPSGTRFFPDLAIGLFSTDRKSGTDNKFLDQYPIVGNVTEILLKPNVDGSSFSSLKSKGLNNSTTFESGAIAFKEYTASLGRLAHYSIQVEKQRLRFWVDGHKVFDAPRAINLSPGLNQIYLNCLKYWFYNEDNFGLYVSNFRIATGIPKPGETLLSKGAFSTSGILFETGSDHIKPQSMGIIKDIGRTLSEDNSISISIVGHTDTDGDAEANQQLSAKRAEAVKQLLTTVFKISPSRIEATGKGETASINDNKTEAAKALNRRVDFIRVN